MSDITVPQLTLKSLGGPNSIPGPALTHEQMNNNFRSLVYSSSIHDGGDLLKLHYNIVGGYSEDIPLSGGSGGLTISPNTQYQIVTATGTPGLLQSESEFIFNSGLLTLTGTFSIDDGEDNVVIGKNAGGDVTSGKNTSIGVNAGNAISNGLYNTAVGHGALLKATTSQKSVGIGYGALSNLITGNCNVGIGNSVGAKVEGGDSNVLIGESAGPTAAGSISNKLYINNSESDTPLILGDFTTGHVTINSTVSASAFSGSYYGDGSNLTGLTAAAEWDGTLDGNAHITGSLTVSSSVVDFTNSTAISGSSFSGSFQGDGSGLTGVQATVFPYTGSAIISGSLLVEDSIILSGSTEISGSLTTYGPSDLNGKVTIDDNIEIYNPVSTTIAIGANAVGGSNNAPSNSVVIGYYAGQYALGVEEVIIGSQAASSGVYRGVAIGYKASSLQTGHGTIAIGYRALGSFNASSANDNIAIGCRAMGGNSVAGEKNVGIGCKSLYVNQNGKYNTAIGVGSLCCLIGINSLDGQENTALGYLAGAKTKYGNCNLYLGHKAGPSSVNTTESNKLYIANDEGYPLIGGDFSTPSVTISGSLLVSESVSAQSFIGDGSGLTGINSTAFPYSGSAVITGSLTVSSSIVDFTNSIAISGSNFSGSYEGDGSGLTGVTSEWDGTRNGDAQITGSLIVSGALTTSDTVTIASSGYPGGPGVELIHFHSASLNGVVNIHSFAISATGYTGFKADYSLSDSTEDEKKIGTLLGAWDGSGGETINDSHTVASGNIQGTSFSIDSDGSNAVLKLDASSGTYSVNMLITAFKKQV